MLYDRIRSLPGFDHEHDFPWLFERGDEIFELLKSLQTFMRFIFCEKCFCLAICSIVDTDAEPFLSNIQGKVFSHHGEADESDLTISHVRGD